MPLIKNDANNFWAGLTLFYWNNPRKMKGTAFTSCNFCSTHCTSYANPLWISSWTLQMLLNVVHVYLIDFLLRHNLHGAEVAFQLHHFTETFYTYKDNYSFSSSYVWASTRDNKIIFFIRKWFKCCIQIMQILSALLVISVPWGRCQLKSNSCFCHQQGLLWGQFDQLDRLLCQTSFGTLWCNHTPGIYPRTEWKTFFLNA